MKTKLTMVLIIVVALLLAMLAGILVTRASADGPVLWKRLCPAHYEVVQIKEGLGTHVVCVRSAEVER